MRLHYNKLNGIFSLRREDRSTVFASERHGVIPFIGDTVELAPRVHVLITRGEYLKAARKERPFVSAVVTRFPRIRLFIKRIKEVMQ